ncbi:DUF2284 domain-containing protein [Ruminococcaceae bacterium OttesenSCG-928-A11]|nr:DUF2284 domain-containing protein [Ruminococcaceae bacterium OttesenSCG-928-A11]
MDRKQFQDELVATALEMGAQDAKIFAIEDIAFDPRTLLKCLFGCGGGLHYCPTPETAPASAMYTEMIKKYKWGILMRSGDLRTGQDITLALEGKAFYAGYTFAFGATECVNCQACTREEEKPCVAKHKMRPPLYALGIDVYKTVRGLGWELEVVQNREDPAKNITAVFVE